MCKLCFNPFLSQLQFKSLDEEMQALNKGLDKLEEELQASETDGSVSEDFQKVRMCLTKRTL
jgi:DNA-binding protein YbaB